MILEKVLLLEHYVLSNIEVAYLRVNDSCYESAIANLERAIELLKELLESEQ